MSRARQILPKQFYLLTRSCTQRLFLIRPDDATTNAFIYCLAIAAARCRIDVMLSLAESNHHHTVLFDRYGNISAFAEQFHGLFARCQNALRGRFENFWASGEPCITQLVDRSTVIDKLVYTATNPVKDNLVERVHHWPGANTYANFCSGKPLRATRPRHFFRPDGDMPEEVTLEMTIPPELGPAQDVIDEVRAGVDAVVQEKAELRNKTGLRVLGRGRVLEQDWWESPTTTPPRRKLRPRYAGKFVDRVAALLGYRAFLIEYREARQQWLAHRATTFPAGTYWLKRFAAVPIAALPA